MGIDKARPAAKYPRTTLIRPLDGLAKRGRVGRPRTASFTLASTRASIVSWTRDRNDSITSFLVVDPQFLPGIHGHSKLFVDIG